MNLPVIQGLIHRRILANFRVEPEVMQRHIPARFRPKLHNWFAVAGVCLSRLEHIRPHLMPEFVGLSSEEASSFFEGGALGYSVTSDAARLDGLRLETKEWKVKPLDVRSVYSSYFSDENRFPKGSIEFDHVLIMRDVPHEWHSAGDLFV